MTTISAPGNRFLVVIRNLESLAAEIADPGFPFFRHDDLLAGILSRGQESLGQ